MNVTEILKYWILFLFSICLFYMGFHIGKQHHEDVLKQCPISVESSVSSKRGAAVSVHLEFPSQDVKASSSKCIGIDESPRPLCLSDYRHNLSVLVQGKATVPEDIFSFLHHPSSPAKESLFFTENADWGTTKVLESPCTEIYLTRTGSRSNQPNKCVSVLKVPSGHEPINQQSYRMGYTALNTNQYQQDYTRDHDDRKGPEPTLLPPFLRDLESLKKEFLNKMGPAIDPKTGKRKVAIVMVANEGVMDLLLNFLCSAQSIQLDLSSIIVFVGDQSHVSLIEHMGAHAMFSPSLGSMPTKAAGFYLDHTFSRMMWYKTTSVYLALYAGYEVLFQDVDLVWLKDPFPYFEEIESDMIFMDDGARTPRYTPFFVNSGFYFVKHNLRTLYMFESMTKAAPSEIGQTHSHQSVLIRHISESHHLFGLKVFVLDNTIFPSGQAYHENKPLIKKIQAHTFRPYVFHMCWTDNRENKVVYFKDVGLWYLPDGGVDGDRICTDGREMLDYALGHLRRGPSILERCCQKEKYWPAENSK